VSAPPKDFVSRYTMLLTLVVAAVTGIFATVFATFQQRQTEVSAKQVEELMVEMQNTRQLVSRLSITSGDSGALQDENRKLKEQLTLYKQNNEFLTARVTELEHKQCPKP
jgi:cell shape-determining protein MreC